MPDNIVDIQGLTKRYPGSDVLAVDHLSLSLKRGEIFSLLGPNGAGKTTTISMLSCLLAPTEGDATIGGYSITKDSLAARKIIGIVPQEIALYSDLSARENLFFWGRMYGMHGQTLASKTDEILERIGLTDRAKDRLSTFSGGMKRRLNVGVGLIHSPEIVYMDEPTVGIDPQSRRSILDMVQDLNRQGMTVLYTTHYMEEAQELSDRVAIMDHGKVIALGTQTELTQLVGEHQVLRLYISDIQSAEELASSLQKLDVVLTASATDHQVIVNTMNASEALPAIMNAATENGFTIHSVDIQEPNLEAVFLHLTGRALRD